MKHDGDIRFKSRNQNMAVLCMRNASIHNYRNSSVTVDLAMGQIPRSTECISIYWWFRELHWLWTTSALNANFLDLSTPHRCLWLSWRPCTWTFEIFLFSSYKCTRNRQSAKCNAVSPTGNIHWQSVKYSKTSTQNCRAYFGSRDSNTSLCSFFICAWCWPLSNISFVRKISAISVNIRNERAPVSPGNTANQWYYYNSVAVVLLLLLSVFCASANDSMQTA